MYEEENKHDTPGIIITDSGKPKDLYDLEIEATEYLHFQEDFIRFTKENRIEIVIGSDGQYECHINGTGSYGSWLTFLGAINGGIDLYIKQKKNELYPHHHN